MPSIIMGKGLRMVRNDAKVAADTVSASGKVKPGRPVTLTGVKGSIIKYTGVADDIASAILAESDPDKRNALLTNANGRILDGTRVTVTRDVFEALVASHIAAVAADAENPTNVERSAARARLQGFLSGGLVVLPDGDSGGEDALGWAFGIADDDDSDDDDDTDTDDDGDSDSDAADSTAPAPAGKPSK